MNQKLNLLHLYYFHQVAKTGTVTGASLLLNIQQPALSIMLKKFETAIGFAAFEKHGRKLRLTEKGRELYLYSSEVFAKVEKLEEFIGQEDNEVRGKLKIATNDLIAHYMVLPVLKNWMKKYPKLEISLLILSAQEACEKMIKDEIDFGLFFYGPEAMSGIEFENIRKISFSCVAAKTHDKIFIGSREVDYILTRSLPTFEKLKKKWPAFTLPVHTNGLLLHKQLALEGAGAVVLPAFCLKQELQQKRLINLLPSEKLEFSLKLYHRKNKVLSRSQEQFIEEIIQSIDKLCAMGKEGSVAQTKS